MKPSFFAFYVACVLSVCGGTVFAAPDNAAVPAQKTLQVTKPIYAWKTENQKDTKTGAFNHCLVKNMYDNGTVLMLAENSQGVQRLAIDFPQVKMTPGQHFDLTLQVDKRDIFPVEAVAVSPKILTVGIPEAMLDQIRKGTMMYLRGPNDDVGFALDGADGAVLALRDCVASQKASDDTKLAAATTPTVPDDLLDKPVAKEPSAASKNETKAADTPVTFAMAETKPALKQPAKTSESASKPAEIKKINDTPAKTVIADTQKARAKAAEKPKTAMANAPVPPKPKNAAKPSLLSQKMEKLADTLTSDKTIAVVPDPLLPEPFASVFAKVNATPTSLLMESKIPGEKPLDYAWLVEPLFYGAKAQKPVPMAGFQAATVSFLSHLRKKCSGSFVAEASPPQNESSANMTWMVAEVACAPTHHQESIGAVLFANDRTGFKTIYIETTARHGGKAIAQRDAVLAALIRRLQ